MWVLLGGVLLGSFVTHAEDAARVAFRYQVRDSGDNRLTAECPTEEELMLSVEARLGYTPWKASAERVVDAVIFEEGAETVARIYLWHADGRLIGSREVRSKQGCKETADSAALAISIAIAPTIALAKPPRTSQPTSTQKTDERPPVVVSSPPPRHSLKAALFVGGLGTWGAGPSTAGGVDVGVDFRFGIPSVVAAFRYDFPSEVGMDPGRIRSRQMLGQIWVCLNHTFVYGCAGLTGGARHAWAEDLEDAKDGVSAAFWASARLGVNLPLMSNMSLRLYADLAAAITHQRLKETGTGEVFWETPPVGAVWGAALAITFFDGNRIDTTIKQ